MSGRFHASKSKVAVVAVSIVASATLSALALPSDDEIRGILAERLGQNEKDVGIVVGIIEPQDRRIISLGHRQAGDSRPLDGDTVFEIGSVTKVFTAVLLADMVAKNEVALDDRAAKYLPGDMKVPERNGRSITLVDLATHTSGLPFMPENAPPLNNASAAKYSVADLKQFVANYKLQRDIGADWEYSNIGYWLLGEALAGRSKNSFESLMRKRVITPMRLTNTDFVLSSRMKSNLAIGHDAALQPAPDITKLPIYSIMPEAGSLYSTANDLLRFLSIAMNPDGSPLARAIEITLQSRRQTGGDNKQALGWSVIGKTGNEIIFRDGGTYGFANAIAFDPEKRIGVVVLSNQLGDVNDVARHLLQPDFPLAKPTNTKHTEIAIDSVLLDKYAGRYEAVGEGIFTVAREGDFLTFESPGNWGLPKLRIRPESAQDFFATELPLRVAFKIDNDGRATGLLIYPPRGQKAVLANRSDK